MFAINCSYKKPFATHVFYLLSLSFIFTTPFRNLNTHKSHIPPPPNQFQCIHVSHTHTQTDIYICINIKLAERALTHARTHTDTCKQKLFGNLTCSCAVTINAAAVNSLRATGTRATSSRGNSHKHTHAYTHAYEHLSSTVYVCV